MFSYKFISETWILYLIIMYKFFQDISNSLSIIQEDETLLMAINKLVIGKKKLLVLHTHTFMTWLNMSYCRDVQPYNNC